MNVLKILTLTACWILCVFKESKLVHDFTGFPMQLNFCWIYK